MVDQALLMCEMVDPSTSTSAQVVCVSDTSINIYINRENCKIGYEGQIKGYYLV